MRIVLDLQACQASSMNRGIGRYSLALAHAMIQHGTAHDVRIVVNSAFPDSAAALRTTFGAVLPAASIGSFAIPMPTAENDPRNAWRVQAAEHIRESYLASLRPDIVHVSSLFEGFGDNSVNSVLHGAGQFDTAVTLYDLIPLLRKERYLDDPNMAAWYHRKLNSLKQAELLVAISANARDEAIAALGLPPAQLVNISSAADAIFAPRTLAPAERADLLARHGLRDRFIMYTGGLDYRKNIEGLIEAYAALPGELRRQYQLAVVCSVREPDRIRLQRLAAKLRLAGDDLVLTGYVPDDDLVALYNCTSLFVFPSLHEGFGLPVLEAMACGVPVIGSNNSSIPEVIGRPDAMFDPSSVTEITAAMMRVLTNPDFANALRMHGLSQAKLFSWDATAKRALAAFEEVHERRVAARTASVTVDVSPGAPRPRLAFVSPLPPARSGIADYSAGLLPELQKYYDIDLVLAQPALDAPWSDGTLAQREVDWFDAHAHEYDRIVYQFGNSDFHAHMFGLLARHPGVVVLHDFFMSEVLSYIESESALPNLYCRALYLAHGYRALAEERVAGRAVSCRTYPCNKEILDRATGVIVHSAHAMALAAHWYGPEMVRDWRAVPLLRQLPAAESQVESQAENQADARADARAALGIGDGEFMLCSFGMLTPNKCIDQLVQAWLSSAAGHDPRCRLVLVGAPVNDAFADALQADIGAHPRIKVTGYADVDLYRRYLAAADAAVQLRSGSRGETSAAVLDCLAQGLPTIVNAHGSAAELPAEACIVLDDAFSGAALSAAIDTLHTDAHLRMRLAAVARAYMEAHGPARACALMRDAIEQFYHAGDNASRLGLLRALSAIPAPAGVPGVDRLQAAAAIAANRPPGSVRQLLIDVTHLAQRGSASEPQRKLIAELIAAAPLLWRIEPVYLNGEHYRYARTFTLELLGRADLLLENAVADPANGDILLVIDPNPDAPSALPADWLARGVARWSMSTTPGSAMEILSKLH